MRDSLRAEFSAPFFFVRRHSAGLGVKKRESHQFTARFSGSCRSAASDGRRWTGKHDERKARPRSNCSSAPRRIHNLRLSLPPLPTLSPSNPLKCLFSFDVDGGSHAAAQIRDMMENTPELRVRGALPARPAGKCLS